MDRIHIFLASDDNYAQHSGVVLASLLANHNAGGLPLAIHYLDGGLSAVNRDRISSIVENCANAELIFHEMSGEFRELKTDRYITHATYYRLKIDSLAGNDVCKAIYLDTDVLVFGDIEEMWNIDIAGYAAGAVEDAGLRDIMPKLKKQLKMPQDSRYFNSGVLLLNLNYWREQAVGDRVMAFLHTCPRDLPHHDQDALNATLWQETLFIDPKWNVHKEVYHNYYLPDRRSRLSDAFINAVHHPAIVHYTGKIKPWHYDCGLPHVKEYYKYLACTPWAGYRPTGRSWNGLRRKLGWLLKRLLFK